MGYECCLFLSRFASADQTGKHIFISIKSFGFQEWFNSSVHFTALHCNAESYDSNRPLKFHDFDMCCIIFIISKVFLIPYILLCSTWQ